MLYAIIAILTLIIVALIIAFLFVFNKYTYITELFEETVASIENSHDVLKVAYKKIDYVSNLPVSSDDPSVRMVVNAVKDSKEVLGNVLDKLTIIEEDEDNKE